MRIFAFRSFVFVLAVLIFSAYAVPAYPDVLCVQKNVKPSKKTGALNLSNAIRKSAATCPKGFTTLLDTAVFQGPQGATGPMGPTGATGPAGATGATGAQGPAGMVNLDSCVRETAIHADCAEGDVCLTILSCGGAGTSNGSAANDYMIAWDWTNDYAADFTGALGAYLTESGFLYATNKSYPTGAWIQTTSEDGHGLHRPELGIICCLPN